ncbi:MAG: potassium channel protein [Acidimicrobiia bacterium]|nr:potassium channel protein [Acidimicrobiia bacterium]NNF08934.1 potassium channel protein [Acidimicrobiia bacterium]NNL70926.1 potassium channel protein [Acidimicrobiia bacterium]RZV40862.1 MAG: potassium channel protein [Acidimicrobiia bacterium]
MTAQQRLTASGLLLLVLTVVGTLGYVFIEGAPVFDAFYMTIITVSTVGFEEVFELSSVGRTWSVVLVVLGVGLVFYTATAAIEVVIANQPNRRKRALEREIDNLSSHYIVCGWGRVGRNAWQHIADEGESVVVIDSDPGRCEAATAAGALVVEGNATSYETLEKAGLERAAGLVASVADDSDNLVIVLSARSVRPDLLITARANEGEAEEKLVLAGADRVVAPPKVGGHRLAALVLHRELADFVDLVHGGRTVEFKVEEFLIDAGSALAGVSLRESHIRGRSGAMIFAVEEPGGGLIVNPDPDLVFLAGATVVAIGTDQQLSRLRELVGSTV